MKTSFIFFIGMLLSLSSQAQNLASEPKGSYGGDGKNAPHLQLKEDHTFIYTDLTKASKPVVAEGTWSLEGDELVLEPNSKTNLNKRYTMTREGMCIKTRKNFAFYTLCNCK
ncbi:hypothetical protein [Fluviicola sp.]|uniref:hypothetical protein n=1 Tax=Fluviicola sp. TaxID=1917219 RepID=UPI0031D26CEA